MGRTSSSRRLGWALTAQGRGRLGEVGDRKGLAQVLRERTHSAGSFNLTWKHQGAHGSPTEAGTPCASSHSADKPCTCGVQPC